MFHSSLFSHSPQTHTDTHSLACSLSAWPLRHVGMCSTKLALSEFSTLSHPRTKQTASHPKAMVSDLCCGGCFSHSHCMQLIN